MCRGPCTVSLLDDIKSSFYLCIGTVMFQLRRRAEHPSTSLRKSGSMDDVKVPRMLQAVAHSPGKLASVTCLTAVCHSPD